MATTQPTTMELFKLLEAVANHFEQADQAVELFKARNGDWWMDQQLGFQYRALEAEREKAANSVASVAARYFNHIRTVTAEPEPLSDWWEPGQYQDG